MGEQRVMNARQLPVCVDNAGHTFSLPDPDSATPTAVCQRCGLTRRDTVTTG